MDNDACAISAAVTAFQSGDTGKREERLDAASRKHTLASNAERVRLLALNQAYKVRVLVDVPLWDGCWYPAQTLNLSDVGSYSHSRLRVV